jgi:DNA-directed RNA polymerase subunit omega
MKEIVTEELLKKIENRFLLSIVAARRARQIKDGAVPLVDKAEGDNDLAVALLEINEGKIQAELNPASSASEDDVKVIQNTKKSKK